MLITNVNVYKIERENSRLKGIASVFLDNQFVVKNIRIIEGDKGLFIAMPNRFLSPGKRADICNPLNKETRKMFEDAIISKYKEN